ncbi:hypothetical protein E4U40_006966 [Claviceps sp. LM458 group G5]|nr:hypothetical protein E4U40_006966 [Claviceps sp. LM458 group G5]
MVETKTMDETDRVLALVRCVDLKYPDGQLLEAFLRESIDPLQTARYILGNRALRTETLSI